MTTPNPERAAQGLGALVALVAAVVLGGWVARSPAIVQLLPSFVPMQVNTALGFLALGLAIVMLARGSKHAWIPAVLAFANGALVLVEYAADIDLGIDTLLIEPFTTTKTSHPGRMAPNTAVCFMLAGTAIALTRLDRVRARWTLAGLLGSVVIALGAVGAIGYAAGLATAYGWGALTRMALHTAVLFVVSGIALVLLARHATAPFDRAARPIAIATFLAVGAVLLGLALLQSEETATMARTRVVVAALEQHARTAFDDEVLALERMAHRWDTQSPTPEQWQTDAANYVHHMEPLVALARFDATGRRVGLVGAAQQSDERVTRPAEPRHDLSVDAFRVTLPIAGGTLVAWLEPERMFHLASPAFLEGFGSSATIDGDPVYRTAPMPEVSAPFMVERHYDAGGVEVGIAAWPLAPDQNASLGPWLVVFAGLALALALGWALVLGARNRRRSTQLSTLIESSPVGMLVATEEGVIRSVNPAARSMFAAGEGELVGDRVDELVLAPTDPAEPLQRRGRRVDGLPIDLQVSEAPVEFDERRHRLITVADVSQIRRAERSLREHAKRLEDANETLQGYNAVASHDLRAPLRGIQRIAEWLEEDLEPVLTDETREHLESLKVRAARLEAMIDAMAQYARAGRVDGEYSRIELAELVDDVIDTLDVPPGFEVIAVGTMPTLTAQVAPLQGVVLNLCTNAIKHHDRENGTVTITATLEGAPPGQCRITVADDGPGIPERYHEQVFGMFKTLKPRDRVEGSGMGLALVKKEVEARGGSVRLESVGERGTRFIVTWPTEAPSHEADPDYPPPSDPVTPR